MANEKPQHVHNTHNSESSLPGANLTKVPPRTVGATLRRLGPGIIVAGSIVGSGELIATTKTGAEAGFWLLWLIIIGCAIKVFTQIELGRYTITWGQTPLKALNSVPGPRLKVNWLLWCWAVLTVLVVSQMGGIVGGVGQALAINLPLTQQGVAYNQMQDELVKAKVELAMTKKVNPSSSDVHNLQQKMDSLAAHVTEVKEPKDAYLWALIITVVTSVLLFIGRYGLIQTMSMVLVMTFTFVTILTVVVLQTKPDWAVRGHELANGLSFRLPPVVEGISRNPIATALAAFGLIGVGAAELIFYPYWCMEKGYARFTGLRDGTAQWAERARGWIRVMNIDAWTSMLVYTFATVAFYLLGAAVLGRTGLNPEKSHLIRTLAEMYVPVFGQWAPKLFLFGAFAVLYSTFFVAAASNARVISDALGLFGLTDGSEAARLKWTRIISVVWPLAAFAVYMFVRAPAAMILASGVGHTVMLPMLGAAVMYFRYRRCDKNLRPGPVWDTMLWLSFIGFVIAGCWSLFSIIFK